MSKVAIVYWSGTGNTAAMAEFVAEGAKAAGASVDIIPSAEFTADKVSGYDALAFGCPSMGSEQLEEMDFQPMWDEVKGSLSGKKIGLFGSYGWGDGEWMRNWRDECATLGVSMPAEDVIANGAPDEDAAGNCRALGGAIAG